MLGQQVGSWGSRTTALDRAIDGMRSLSRNRRELARQLLGERLAQEFHARRWARTLPQFLDPARRPYEMALVDRFVGPGDTVLDLGAHGGAWTYPLAKRVGARGRVHAFEIFSYYADTLERALALKRIDNVQIHKHGVGKSDSEVSIVLVDEDDTVLTGMIHTAAPHERPRQSQQVEIRSFDSMAQTNPELLEASFAKIDIEGSEFAVFLGASRLLQQARPVIFCEVTKRQCRRNGHSRQDVLEYVCAADYGAYVYLPSGQIRPVHPADPDLPGDFLFIPQERSFAAAA
jgi:FkbM family methyltransferase